MIVNCLPLLLGLGLLDLWQTYMLKGNTKFTNSMMPNFPIFVHPACSYTTEIPRIMQKCCTLKEKWNGKNYFRNCKCLKFSVQIDGAVDSQQQDKKYVFVRYNRLDSPLEIKTRLLSVRESTQRGAEGLFNVILSFLSGISEDIIKTKFAGITTDGESANTDRLSGLWA